MLKKLLRVFFLALVVSAATYAVDYASNLTIGKSLDQTGTYQVTTVFDGDTIEVLMDGRKEKVRFIGVNTPETGGHDTQIECYGPEASEFMKELLTGKRVILTADPKSNNRDLYDRLLRYIKRADDGLDINLELIKQGYSRAYLVFPHTRNKEFAAAANEAKSQGVGIWSACPG